MKQQHYVVQSLAEVQSVIDKITLHGKRFGFDVETDSLDWRNCNITCSQLSYKDDNGVFHGYMIPHGFKRIKEVLFRFVPQGENPLTEVVEDVEGNIDFVQTIQLLKQLFTDKEATATGSNLKYDFLVCLHYDPTIEFKLQVMDTTLSAALLHKTFMGLKENVMQEFQHSMLTFEDHFGGDASRSMLVDMKYMADYCVPDVTYGLALALEHERQLKVLESDTIHNKKYKLWSVIENPNVIYLAYMEFFGITLDCDAVRSMDGVLTKRLSDLEAQIYEEANATPNDFSIGSSKELVEFFLLKHKHWSTDDTERTAGPQQYSCDGPTLLKFSESGKSTDVGQSVATLIIQHRKLSKLISTYMSLPDIVDENKRLHTSFTQLFTVSARLSSRSPNLQNIPARSEEGRELRKAFIAQKGYRLCVADYSNAELRITAHLTGDDLMLDAFINNKDLHEETAKGLGLVSPSLIESYHNGTASKDEKIQYKDSRGVGKTFNFAVGYGAGPHKLRAQLNQGRKAKDKFTLKQVTKFKELFWQTYSGYAKWREDNVKFVKRTGFARGPFGYTQDFRKAVKNREFFDNAANNFPVQNTAGAAIKLAQANILRRIFDSGWFIVHKSQLDLPQYRKYKTQLLAAMQGQDFAHVIKPLLQVHDELILECLDVEEIVELTKQIMSEEMTAAAKLKIPLPAEAGSGYNWLEAK